MAGTCKEIRDTLIVQLKKKFFSLKKLVEMKPDLEFDQEFWSAFLVVKDWLPFEQVPVRLEEIFDRDAELALKLCDHDPLLYRRIPMDHPLKRNEQLVEAYLVACSYTLGYEPGVPGGLLQQHPHLVAGALQRLPLSVQRIQETMIDDFPPELWQQREIVLAWAHGGGNFHDAIPDAFKDDGELTALFLRPDDGRIDEPDERLLSDRLLSDKQFMMGMVVANPCLLQYVGTNLVGDTDLFIAALSGPAGLSILFSNPWIVDPWGDWLEAGGLVPVAEAVREKMQSHDVFLKLILGGDCDAVRSSLENGLPLSLYKMLSGVNKETSLVFKKVLAEYIGVPTTKQELEMLRGARRTLALAGFHWPDHVKCSFLEGEDRMYQVD